MVDFISFYIRESVLVTVTELFLPNNNNSNENEYSKNILLSNCSRNVCRTRAHLFFKFILSEYSYLLPFSKKGFIDAENKYFLLPTKYVFYMHHL